jgi:hypothetical protein
MGYTGDTTIQEKVTKSIVTCDGKYETFNNNGILTVKRHGQPWEVRTKDLIGDGYVLSLIQRIEELEEQIKQ